MSVSSGDSPPATYKAMCELKSSALDDFDIDLLKSGDLGWLNEVGSVWSSVHHGRVTPVSVSTVSVSGSLDLSAEQCIAAIEFGLPKSDNEDLLPVDAPIDPSSITSVPEDSTVLLASPSPSSGMGFKAIEESLMAEATQRMSLQRQLLELEEERYRVELTQQQVMEMPSMPPLPPAPAFVAQKERGVREIDERLQQTSQERPVAFLPDSKPLDPLQAALSEMSDCVSLLAASSGVCHYNFEEPMPRVRRSSPPPPIRPTQRKRVLVLPQHPMQSQHPMPPPVPTYCPPQQVAQPVMALPSTYPEQQARHNVFSDPQPELCDTLQKQVKGCRVDQVVVTTKYDDGLEDPVQRTHNTAPLVLPTRKVEPEVSKSTAMLTEQTTQTGRVVVEAPHEKIERVVVPVGVEIEEQQVSVRENRGRSKMPLSDVSNIRHNTVGSSKESKASMSSRGSRGSRGSSGGSKSGGRVRLRGAPRCANVQTASSDAKRHIHEETWPPVAVDARPPFRPSSISPKRKKLPKSKSHRVPYRMATTTLLAPTESSRKKVHSRSPVRHEPHHNVPVARVTAFGRHAHSAHVGSLRLGASLTA